MAITLAEISITPKVHKDGNDTITLPPGKTMKIETSPDGEEIMNETVPAGKQWTITVGVHIVETDA